MGSQKKDLKQALKGGDTVVGGYIQTLSTELLEITGQIGFDFAILSSEDTAYEIGDRSAQVYAAEAVGIATVFRPASNDPVAIRRALDLGMNGINVPLVTSAEDTRSAVRAALYSPLGTRGLNAMSRPVAYGAKYGPTFFETANDSTLVTILIETAEAIQNIHQILAVDGVDVVHIGRTDLALALGVPGEVNHPVVEEAVEKVRLAALERGVALAHTIYDPTNPDEITKRVNEGYQMLSVFLDVQLFRLAATRLQRQVSEVVNVARASEASK